jgi:WD40 repeat protein
VHCIAFSPDGRTLAIGGDSGVLFWHPHSPKSAHLFIEPLRAELVEGLPKCALSVEAITFSPDGRILACIYADGRVCVRDVRTKRDVACVKGKASPRFLGGNHSIAFAPDGKSIAFSRPDNRVAVQHLDSDKSVRHIATHDGPVKGLLFLPDRKSLISASDDGTVRRWDLPTGTEIWRVRGHAPDGIAIALTHKDCTVISGDGTGRLRVIGSVSGDVLRQFQGPSCGFTCLAVSPDDRVLAGASENEAVWRWDLTSRQPIGADVGHTARIVSVAFSADNHFIVTASADGTGRLWDAQIGKPLAWYVAAGASIRACAYGKDRAWLAGVGDPTGVHIWSAMPAGSKLVPVLTRPGVHVDALSVDHNGVGLVAGGDNERLRFWTAGKGTQLCSIPRDQLLDRVLICSGRSEALTMSQTTISLVDLWDGQEINRITEPEEGFRHLCVSSDERLVAVASRTGLGVYELASGQLLRRLDGPGVAAGSLSCITFPAGDRFLTGGTQAGIIIVWDLATGKVVRTMRGDSGEVVCLACSRDGTMLVSGNADTTALVWKAEPSPNSVLEVLTDSSREDSIPALAWSIRLNRLPPGVFLWNTLYLFGASHAAAGASLSAEDCADLWEELLSARAKRAYKAIWSLCLAPSASVPYLSGRLRPVAAPDSRSIRDSVQQLGSDHFRVRQQAFDRLRKLGDVAVPALRLRLLGTPSVHERRSIEALLRQAKMWSPEDLRILRAIQIIEYIGTREAQEILTRLARGAPESRLTKEAQASLWRLNRTQGIRE